MPTNESGGFSMTTITIGTSFGGGSAKNNYQSNVYDKFIGNLDKNRQGLENIYKDTEYPVSSSLAGQKYDPANGGVDIYSADVMIPSFLDAYTGIGGNEIFLFTYCHVRSDFYINVVHISPCSF